MSTSTLLLSLFEYKAWANDQLFTQLQKVEAGAHATERHAAIRLLNHVYVVDRIFAAHLTGTTHPYKGTNTPETPTLEELGTSVAATDRWYLEHIRTLDAERLAEKIRFVFTDGAPGTMSREEILGHVATHGGYHRGAVGRIMAQASVPPPRDIFTVYLHEAEPARRGRA